jgi:cytosine deaminase
LILAVRRPANLPILSVPDDYEVLRSQDCAQVSSRHGEVLMQRTPAQVQRLAR